MRLILPHRGVLWVMMMTVWMMVGVCEAGVGVWMDDGNGRTVLADNLGSEEAAELARDILDVLDLPAPPLVREGRHHHHIHLHRAHGSAPTWLKSVYDTLDEHGHANSAHMDATHRETVTAADTIITFVSRDPPHGRPHHGANKRLYFDVRDVPLDHSLLGAEIQIYRFEGHDEPLSLHVYMINDDEESESEVARVTLREPGWVSINVTAPVLSWLIFPNTNFGLRLAVTSLDRRHERRFHEVGVSGAKDQEDYRPFMVGFFALPSSSYKKKRIRTARSASAPPPPPRSRLRTYRDITDRPIGSDTLCKMKHLHVSFRDLGWENWVIAPEGYDANYCEGHCVFPLQAELNATNHALVQTLVKVIDEVSDDHEVPPNACCAPIDLATIPVLYYSYENNIVLKKYPKMIVKTCGCL
ncbi:protein 60A-like [Homarus americanus]|uniref:protein 60A-like n=1 Tax=Homarus americanus TaxID=6706 RepID=UPI001C4947B2|nr:protein 60A-like [Homarus americanus]XP_042226680.1 protein 60A-like [Homarus americanus]